VGWRVSWVRVHAPGWSGPRPGWPRRVLRGGAVPVRAAPGPVPEPAQADHGGCRVVAGRFGVVFHQRGEPVLGSPPGGVGRIGDDDVQAGVGGHLHEAVAELSGAEVRELVRDVLANNPLRC